MPDDAPHEPYWTRPRVADVEATAAALERGERPFRMRGELWGALGAAIARHDRAAVARLRDAVLDRDTAVPLHFLETFARR